MNALRGHLAEFGVIAPQGLRNVGKLIAIVRDEGDARLPDLARQVLQVLAVQIEQLEAAVAAIEKQLMAWHKSNPVSQRLASVPASFNGYQRILDFRNRTSDSGLYSLNGSLVLFASVYDPGDPSAGSAGRVFTNGTMADLLR